MGSIKSERFRGVRQRQWGSWVSEIRHPITKIRVWLGTFHSAEEAALAYDEAARFISGAKAKTNFPYNNNCNSQKMHQYCTRLSPALREKLRRCCCMEFSPTRKLAHVYQDLSQSMQNMNAAHNFRGIAGQQCPCRNMFDNSRYAIFSSWNDLSETDHSTSEETEKPQMITSDEESNQIQSNEMNSNSLEQLVANHDIRTEKESQLDDYIMAEMIDELLNSSSSFELEFDSVGLSDLSPTMVAHF